MMWQQWWWWWWCLWYCSMVDGTLVTTIQDTLVIKACCGDERTCEQFDRAEDLLGVACCGVVPINQFTHMCCAKVVHERLKGNVYHELCCGNQTLSYAQTCCDGVVHNKPNAICCGTEAYDSLDQSKLCCNGTLIQDLTTGASESICCGSEAYDGGIKEICCGNQVYDKAQYDSCCRANDGSFQPFRSDVQFCCDAPVQRGAGNACCYLRPNGAVVPTPYNTATECCKFPYLEILPAKECTDTNDENGIVVDPSRKLHVSEP